MITALVGFAVTPGPALGPRAGARAGAVGAGLLGAAPARSTSTSKHDTDRLMARTRGRAFVTGALPHTPAWLVLIGAAAGRRRSRRRGMRLNAIGGAVRLPRRVLLRRRLHGVAQAAHLAQHRRRRPGRQFCGAGRRRGGGSGSWARCRCCWRWCCSCGRRRISGAWPSPTRPTTRPPACRCCRWWWAPQRAAHIVFGSTARAGRGVAAAGVLRRRADLPGRRRWPAAATSFARPGDWRARRAARRRWRRSSRRWCN